MKIYTPTDFDDWLNFRRPRLTSTELAKLHLSKTAATWQKLRGEKESGVTDFHGNAYTTWGTEREPLLAPSVVQIDSRLVYNNEPQNIVVNPHDDGLCCTPDLYSEDGEVIGEIKTSGKQFAGGQFHEWAPDQYYLQCQLNMEYVGADACVLLVEYRDGTPEDGFTPRSVEYRILTPDTSVVEAMLNTADEWLRWIEHDERPEWMGEVDGLDEMDELAVLIEQLAADETEHKLLGTRIKESKSQIEELVGGSYVGEVAGYKLTVAKTKDSLSFDSTAFRKKHADLYKEFQTKKRAGYTRITIKEVS